MTFLAIFAAVLQGLDATAKQGLIFRTVEDFAAHICHQAAVIHCLESLLQSSGGAEQRQEASFSTLVEHVRTTHPPLEDWRDPSHEINLAAQLVSKPATSETFPEVLAEALRVLALLALREPSFPAGYGDLALTAADLENYPINLISFSKRTAYWQSCSLQAVIEEVIIWSLNTHLSEALRKLRQT